MKCRWCLGVIVLVSVAGCGSGGSDSAGPSSTTAVDIEPSPPSTTDASTSSSAEPSSTIGGGSTAPDGTAVVSSEPTEVPAEAAPNVIPSGSCPSGEFPALGAFSVEDGAAMWARCSSERVYRTLLAVSDSIVLVGENAAFDDDHIVAYHPGSGEERWRLPVSSRAGVSLPDEVGVDVVAFEVGTPEAPYVVGIELSSGTERWATEIGLTLIAQSAEIVVLARPDTIENNHAVGGVIGVDRDSGEQRWVNDELVYGATDGGIARTDTALAGDVAAIPVFDITASAPGDVLKGVDINTGTVQWTAAPMERAATSDGVIVGIPSHLNVRAISAADGTTLWTSTGDEPYGVPLAAGDGLVVVTDTAPDGARDVVGYELSSGEPRWRAPIPFLYVHTVTDSTAILLWDSELLAISTADGSTRWSLSSPLETSFMNNAIANQTTVFVAVNSLPWND